MSEPARRAWEYATIPLLIHATKAILDSWGVDGWELVTVVPGPGRLRPARSPTSSGRMSARELARPPGRAGHPAAAVAPPVAAYVPAVRTGSLVFTSGQLPFVDGGLRRTGKVGGSVDVEAAAADAKVCALNALAAIDELVGLDSVARVVKVVGFVASAEGFTGQPRVVNGASELLGKVFGEAGQHARSAVGVAELPLGAPVEVELTVELTVTSRRPSRPRQAATVLLLRDGAPASRSTCCAARTGCRSPAG